MKASDYIAERISKETLTVFGVTGGAIINLFDSLHKKGFNLVPMHHEQAAAMAADAYARLRGFGCVVATSGPGATNLITGTCCSWFDSVPVLTIAGQVPTTQLKKRRLRQFGFQETDSVSLFKPITKFAKRVSDVQLDLDLAILSAKLGRKGPTFLELCDDTQREEIFPVPSKIEVEPLDPLANSKKIASLKKMLQESKRPLLIFGAGAPRRLSVIEDFIGRLGIPVLLTWGAIDLLRHDHPLNIRDFGICGNRAGNLALQNADLIISFGARLDTHEVVNSSFAPKAKKVLIDIDKAELDKHPADLKIHSDIARLIDFSQEDPWWLWEGWRLRLKSLQEKYPMCPKSLYEEKKVNPYAFIDYLSEKTPSSTTIVTDAGATLTWTMQTWKVKNRQRLFSAFNHSPMGYALPASIGAMYGSSWNVICITGDGGLMMNLQELQTIAGRKLPIKIFVMNNHEYGIIKQTQSTWPALKEGVMSDEKDLSFPDFIKLGKSLGFKTAKIKNHRQLRKIKKLLKHKGPVLCSVEIPSDSRIKPKMVLGGNLNNLWPERPKKEIEVAEELLCQN